MGVPDAPQWRTAADVATFGPRHFGFDLDFVPLEERRPGAERSLRRAAESGLARRPARPAARPPTGPRPGGYNRAMEDAS